MLLNMRIVEGLKKARVSDNTIFTLPGFAPWFYRCIIMEEAQTTHDPVSGWKGTGIAGKRR